MISTSYDFGWKPDLCIYHGDCLDGFGAAWAVWLRWPDCQFYAGRYGAPLPQADERNVLFVDFSPSSSSLIDLAKLARSVVIIDHHANAQLALADFPFFDGTISGLARVLAENVRLGQPAVAAWFDPQQSGAAMAWQFVHDTNRRTHELPLMVALIEDRDLWHFRFGDKTRRVAAVLQSYALDFAAWSKIADDIAGAEEVGQHLLRAHLANVERFASEAFFGQIAGQNVPVANLPYLYATDTANKLLDLHPDAPFTASWFRRSDGLFQYALRSTDQRLDVSEIAKRFGGAVTEMLRGSKSGPS
ncbi:hypothetical protein [Devosia riboflavina]